MSYAHATLGALSLLSLAWWLWFELQHRRNRRALDDAKRKEYVLLWTAFNASTNHDERMKILRRIDRAEWDWLDRKGTMRGLSRSRRWGKSELKERTDRCD